MFEAILARSKISHQNRNRKILSQNRIKNQIVLFLTTTNIEIKYHIYQSLYQILIFSKIHRRWIIVIEIFKSNYNILIKFRSKSSQNSKNALQKSCINIWSRKRFRHFNFSSKTYIIFYSLSYCFNKSRTFLFCFLLLNFSNFNKTHWQKAKNSRRFYRTSKLRKAYLSYMTRLRTFLFCFLLNFSNFNKIWIENEKLSIYRSNMLLLLWLSFYLFIVVVAKWIKFDLTMISSFQYYSNIFQIFFLFEFFLFQRRFVLKFRECYHV